MAVVVSAWFALGIRQSHDVAEATAILARPGPVGASRAAEVSALLRAAKPLNPDNQVDVLRVQLAIRCGDLVTARRIALDVAAEEPMNVQAWLWLARASRGSPETFVLALAHFSQLVPPVRSRR